MNRETIVNYVRKKHLENPDKFQINPDDSAADIPEMGLIDMYKDIWNHNKEKITADEQIEIIDDSLIDEAEEILEVEEMIAEEVIDIDALLKIEERVVNILQYLNVSLYDGGHLSEVIVEDMKREIIKQNYSEEFIDRIESIVRDLVQHEFKEYEFKKAEFRKSLVRELYKNLSDDLDKLFEQHRKHRSKRITAGNIANYLTFVYESIFRKHIVAIKNKKNIGASDFNYLKQAVKEILRVKYKNEFDFDFVESGKD